MRLNGGLVKVLPDRKSGAVRGVFLMALERDNLFLTHVSGNLSPDNVKGLVEHLTITANRIGLLQPLEQGFAELHQRGKPHRNAAGVPHRTRN